jgi:HlyD family secretion protein
MGKTINMWNQENMDMKTLINKLYSSRVFFIKALVLLITACSDGSSGIQLPGYIEGKYIYIASAYPGLLQTLKVNAGDKVVANQFLFSLNPHPEEDELHESQARIEQAKAELQKQQANYTLQKSIYDRKKGLFNRKVISTEEFDSVTNQLQQTDSGLLSAQANILALTEQTKKIEWIIKQKTLAAPTDGTVFDVYYREGETIPGSSPVLALLPANEVKAIFYCPEEYLGKIKLNQPVSLSCDNCSGPIKAKISYISPQAEFTPPVLYSNEGRSKLSYRIEAQPLLPTNTLTLHPGQPITVRLKG